MKIHQMIIEKPGTLLHKELSCYCCSRSKDVCKCHNLTDASVTPTLSSVAQRLNVTIEQEEIFERRWRESFNPVMEDLGVLSPEEREEYMRWKVWRNLRGDHSENTESDSDEGDSYHYH